ncbi:MAG: DEAD/DEAH box helicase [Pseudomonadota bacterium]
MDTELNFETLGFQPKLLKRLAKQGILKPTPIQEKAIPHVIAGRDVMGLAQTGTGKTVAFGLPLIQALLKVGTKPAPKTVRGLILAPTRELANQIWENLRSYTGGTHLKVALIVGGASIGGQIHRLQTGTDLMVATPGRLIDLLDRRAVRLDCAEYLVLDEADQMLDMGFIHALRKIAPLLPAERQTLLFSATMPKQMAELAAAYLTDPVRIEAAPPGKPADKVDQALHFVEQPKKTALLVDYLGKHPDELSLVFARTKHGAERLMKALVAKGFAAASIHGNKTQGQRDRAIKGFKQGQYKVLVATDVAARGLDIPGVRFVYNFDLPNVPDNYVHRIGRTARAGQSGSAIAFCAPTEMGELKSIQTIIGRQIEVIGGTPWRSDPAKDDQGKAAKPKRHTRRRPGRRPRRKLAA